MGRVYILFPYKILSTIREQEGRLRLQICTSRHLILIIQNIAMTIIVIKCAIVGDLPCFTTLFYL